MRLDGVNLADLADDVLQRPGRVDGAAMFRDTYRRIVYGTAVTIKSYRNTTQF
jgi:hypothetical protein